MDVALLAARRPALLLSATPGADAAASFAALATALPGTAAALPRLLRADAAFLDAGAVEMALFELRALYPGTDAATAVAMLIARPELLQQARPPPPRRDPNDEYYV